MLRQRWSDILNDGRVVMGSTLLLALVIAVGHDRYYAFLNGTQLSTAYFSQTYNIAIGNAFSICVKAALCVAVASAFNQALWYTLLRTSHSVKIVDSLSSLTTTTWALLDFWLIVKFPLLVVIGFVYWALFISIIFPPGSLSVHSIDVPSQVLNQVAKTDWDTAVMAEHINSVLRYDPSSISSSNESDPWPGTISVSPTTGLTTIAQYVALFGDYPPVYGSVLNTTYRFDTTGPAIKCKSSNWTQPLASISCGGETYYNLTYASWLSVPESGGQYFGLQDTYIASNGSMACANFTSIPASTRFTNTNQTLYIAIRDGSHDPSNDPLTWSMTSCELGTANYTAEISFMNGNQTVKTNASNFSAIQPLETYLFPDGNKISDTEEGTPGALIANYLAAFAAFAELTSGVYVEQKFYRVPTIFSSILAYTDEIQAMVTTGTTGPAMQDAMSPIFLQPFADGRDGPLAPKLEDLFRNLTIAISTSRQLGKGWTANATLYQSQLQYKYDEEKLWLSYGLGLLASAIIVLIGVLKMRANGASYSNKFSTYMRALSKTDLQRRDSSIYGDRAADPLPKEIGTAIVSLGHADTMQNDELMPGRELKIPLIREAEISNQGSSQR